jgi:phosphoribosylformylglycinamidine cyclo-ligase
MPGFYAAGEYDLAGFIVGVVDRAGIVDGRSLGAGDRLIGLASAGLHTNGYSLARRIVFDELRLDVATVVPELQMTAGDALLLPHKSYSRAIQPLLGTGRVKGMAHVTGGGITDNLPRILPPRVSARIERGSWPTPALFSFLEQAGHVPIEEMYRTFNMGIGMIVACAAADVDRVREMLSASGERSWVIGELVPGSREVVYC